MIVLIGTALPRAVLSLFVAAALLLGPVFHAAARLYSAGPASIAGLIGDVPICHADGGWDAGGTAPAPGPHDRSIDCALCAMCQTLGAAAMLPPTDGSAIPVAQVIVATRALLPPSRAPPRRPLLATAFPTGPPGLT